MSPRYSRESSVFVLTIIAFGFMGCGSDPSDSSEPVGMNGEINSGGERIGFTGRYGDETGSHVITETAWEQGFTGSSAPALYVFFRVGNNDMYAIAKNGADNEYNPNLFSRFDWIWTEAGLYYCQSAYDSADADVANAVERPDDSNPGQWGCGGAFAWTLLTPAIQVGVVGEYTGSGMGQHKITAHTWVQTYGESTSHFTFTHVEHLTEGAGLAIARNSQSNEFAAGQWSRFEWRIRNGAHWYCQSVYDAATSSAAIDSPPADDSDVENSGCGGAFPWSLLSPVDGE
jgi:hypothetical protein